MSSEVQSEPVQAAAPPPPVRSARDLFQALESGDVKTRLAALQAVQRAPETALSFGLCDNRDVLDVLLSQAERYRGKLEWLNWIGALAAFRDPRVVRLFISLLTTESHGELLFGLAGYLRSESVETIRDPLRPALMQNDCAARSHAVAPLLACCPGLCSDETLRIALLEPENGIPLPVFPDAGEEWLSELAGPFQSQAQLELRGQGAPALAALVEGWDRLQENSRKWLLEWAAETNPDLVLRPVREVLSTRAESLLLSALETAAKLKDFPNDLETLIVPLLDHEDELIRRAAMMACRSTSDWRQLFEKDPSVLVRQGCLRKIVNQEGDDAVSFALQQLANPDWRIRAAAVEAVLLLGKSGVRAAFALLPGAGEAARIGIARMVMHFEDQDLLDEFVQHCSPPATPSQP